MKPLALAGVLALAAPSLAQSFTSSIAAASCGPTLSVTFTPVGGAGNHTIELTCNGLDPAGIGFMWWGQTQVNVLLPNCPILNDFLWGHPVNLDATGSHTWSRSWPHWAIGYYYIQFASISVVGNDLVILTTDSMRAECAL